MVAQTFSDIVFSHQGKLYLSGDLLQLATDDPRNPVIFVRADFTAAFLLSFNDIGVMAVEPLTSKTLYPHLVHAADADAANLLRKCALNLETAERRRPPRKRPGKWTESPDAPSILAGN